MLNHFQGKVGYAGLYVGMLFAVILLTFILAGLTSSLGLPHVNTIAGGVVFCSIFVCAFMSMQRFLLIEGRSPTFSEANTISLQSVGITILAVICLMLVVFVFSIINQIFAGGGGGGGGSRGAGGPPGGGQGENGGGGAKVFAGVITPIFLLYISPLLSFGLLSRIFGGPKTQTT